MNGTTSARRQRRRKMMAIMAGGVAVVIATMATLASWTDNEWVFGGGDTGVGTAEFEVVQNRDSTPPNQESAFESRESNPGGELQFTVDPSGLRPGDAIYAPVALTTAPGSIGGTLTLQPAVQAAGHQATDDQDLLWDTMEYSVRVGEAPQACTADNWANTGTSIVDGQALSDDITPGSQALQGERGNIQYYCFRVWLPQDVGNELQGRAVFPAWQFAAVSASAN